QVFPEQAWLVSETYNFPDFRENGTTALLLPFFAYGRWLPKLETGERRWGTPVDHEDVAQALAALFFSIAAFIVAISASRFYMGGRHIWLSVALLVFGTPTLWYVFLEPYGTDIFSNIVLSGSLFLYLVLLRSKFNPGWWLLLGSSLAFGAAVKVYGAFYLMTIGLQIAARWFLERRARERTHQLIFFSAGAALVSALFLANHFLKFGVLESQYWTLQKYYSLFNPTDFFSSPFYIYFGPSGWIYTSPIYAVAFASAFLWLRDRFMAKGAALKVTALSFRFVLLFTPFFILLMTSFAMVDENIGTARRLAAQQFPFLLGLQFLFYRANAKGPRRFYAAAAVAAGVWGFLMIVRYAANKDIFGEGYLAPVSEWPVLAARLSSELAVGLAGVLPAASSLIGWIPAIAVCAGLLVFVWRSCMRGLESKRALWAVLPLTAAPVVIYCALSISNLLLNRSNIEKLKVMGAFEKTVVGRGISIYIYDDLISVIPKFKQLAKVRGDPVLAEGAAQIERTFLADAASHVIVDPIGFRDACNKGITRPSYFEMFRP
ncbi:MAG: hypothetical protein ABL958_20630, partial [Bdellovibrionia bacterium]